jgi:hypothetical protein
MTHDCSVYVPTLVKMEMLLVVLFLFAVNWAWVCVLNKRHIEVVCG